MKTVAVSAKREKYNRRFAIIIGAGLALFPIHNGWLTRAATSGETVVLFLPALGAAIWIIATLWFALDNWRRLDWGDKKVFVPLLVITGAIGLSGVTATSWQGMFAPLLMALSLLALYLVSRELGKDVFLPLAIGVGIGSLGIILWQIMYHGEATGGFVFERNFDVATGYILLGASLFIHRWQWLLAGLAIIALFSSGAPEAVFVFGVLAVVLLLRRDWSRKLTAVVVALALLASVSLLTGWGTSLFSYTTRSINSVPMAHYLNLDGQEIMSSPLEMRWRVIRDEMVTLRPFGDGYNLTQYTVRTVHNVPLVIVQQLGYPGIIAGLAWLWVTLWCLVKTKWKYAFVLVLALSVFDHFIWTQLSPWWWAIVGVSTASGLKDDLVFRRNA